MKFPRKRKNKSKPDSKPGAKPAPKSRPEKKHHRPKKGGKSNQITGKIKIHRDGYGFVLCDNRTEPDVFIPARYIGAALPMDRVLVEVDRRRYPKVEGKIIQVLERGRTLWTGILHQRGKQYCVINEDFANELVIQVPNDGLKGAQVGDYVTVQVTHFPETSGKMAGLIQESLGTPLSEKAETAAILAKHFISTEFPEAVEAESNAIPDTIPQSAVKGRVDLRHLPIMTIDGVTARDFDDAVAVEKRGSSYHLWVAIADVSHYVRPNTPLDREAFKRGTSVYLPDFAVPMLPEKLSNGLCSLKPGEDRLTLVCEMRFSAGGVLEEAWYYEAVIRSQKRGIYEEVQNFYDGTPSMGDEYSAELRKSLHTMKDLAHLLMSERTKRGSIDFDLPEAQIVYGKEGKIEAIVQANRVFTHRLIEEFMIAANVAVATLFGQRGVVIPYRVHERPDPLKLQDFGNFIQHIGVSRPKDALYDPKDFSRFLETVTDHPMAGIIHQLLLRSMKVAFYGPENRGHFGLSLKNYCHFTSPIRRYPDLIVHRQLRTLLRQSQSEKIHLTFENLSRKPRGAMPQKQKDKKGPAENRLYEFDEIDSIGTLSSQREREAMEAEREAKDLKFVFFMKDHVGEKFYGTIRRITKFGMFVGLDPHLVDGLLHVSDMDDDYYEFDELRMELKGRKRQKKSYRVGDKLWVRVADVSISERITKLEMADEKDN